MSASPPRRPFEMPAGVPFEHKPSPGRGWGIFATKLIHPRALIFSDFEKVAQRLTVSQKIRISRMADKRLDFHKAIMDAFFTYSVQVAHHDPNKWKRNLFIIKSLFNYSCLPNAWTTQFWVDGEHLIEADMTIQPGEEVRVAYSESFRSWPLHLRKILLPFKCDCMACQPGTPFQRASDVRRQIIRGLRYLLLGVDWDDPKRFIPGLPEQPPVIVNPKLRRAAETFSLPLTSRFVYEVLRVFLMEQEGLVSSEIDVYCQSGRSMLVTMLEMKTESNIAVAEQVLAKKNWMDRVNLALTIWGKKDAGDEEAARKLRKDPPLALCS
ncbi:hypothetical protein N7512_005320 [Penicillium capsulatum]|nr:hypothetical protein N7512_005320 [Penicillium capsulatum]